MISDSLYMSIAPFLVVNQCKSTFYLATLLLSYLFSLIGRTTMSPNAMLLPQLLEKYHFYLLRE